MSETVGEVCTESIEIHVTAGPARGRSFVFEKPGRLIFGRAPDAHISVPGDQYVSRQHFELLINPPTCLLRDLSSANGVFINGVHYGGQPSGQFASPTHRHAREVLLDDGDEIVIRETRISISIRSTSNSEPATEVLMSPKGALPDRDIALLLIILPPESQASNPQGETLFSSQIGALLTHIKRHTSSHTLLFLKYLDKGLMMAFTDMEPACNLARELLGMVSHPEKPIRMALHWGTVRTRRNGDVFGREVHRVYRIAAVRMPENETDMTILPQHDYLLMTQQGLAQLSEKEQSEFHSAGTFVLEGFDNPCELWFLAKDASH